MCCFSQPVEYVAATNIFVRPSARGGQFVVYSMTLHAKTELAMILPLPVPKSTPENGVKFINLEKYPKFFSDLQRGFPEKHAVSRGLGGLGGGLGSAPLAVVDVGSFEASFVPTVADFARLDARFRLPETTWKSLPQYKNYGFAVFKLKSGEKKLHPMAFEFPRANAGQLFFPTVHIHDGKIHDEADFDHLLYCQAEGQEPPKSLLHWRESSALAGDFMDVKLSQGIIEGHNHCFMRRLQGQLKNQDTWV